MAGDTQQPVPWLRVAHIVRPHGLRGEVVAELLTDFPERFQKFPAVYLRAPGKTEPLAHEVAVTGSRVQAGRLVLELAGYASMDAAETLRGYDVVIPWSARMPLEEDAIYIADLIDAALFDIATGAVIGTITDVDRDSTSTELLVVSPSVGSGEILIPFVKAYEPAWDAAKRTLSLRLPAGLLEVYTPGASAETEK